MSKTLERSGMQTINMNGYIILHNNMQKRSDMITKIADSIAKFFNELRGLTVDAVCVTESSTDNLLNVSITLSVPVAGRYCSTEDTLSIESVFFDSSLSAFCIRTMLNLMESMLIKNYGIMKTQITASSDINWDELAS